MAKFDIIKHKELADERRNKLHPDLKNTNTTGMKVTKSLAGLFVLLFLCSNVSTINMAQPFLWSIYLILTVLFGYYLKNYIWKKDTK